MKYCFLIHLFVLLSAGLRLYSLIFQKMGCWLGDLLKMRYVCSGKSVRPAPIEPPQVRKQARVDGRAVRYGFAIFYFRFRDSHETIR